MDFPNNNDAFAAVLKFKKGNPVSGACKQAYFGESSIPIFWPHPSTKVCIKEGFHLAPQSGNRIPLDPPKQAQVLSIDMNCARWANAMMKMVYDFIVKENEKRGQPSFVILKCDM